MANTQTLVFSEFSGIYEEDGEEIEVRIYRTAGGSDGWTLEVVNSADMSITWDQDFASENDAYRELLQTLDEEGIHAFSEAELVEVTVH
jgi:hypothetical protein